MAADTAIRIDENRPAATIRSASDSLPRPSHTGGDTPFLAPVAPHNQ